MIIFLSDGRLGNQLFQYAFLKTIAKQNEKVIAMNMDRLLNIFEVKDGNFKFVRINKYMRFIFHKVIEPLFVYCCKLKLVGCIEQMREGKISLPSYSEQIGIFPIRFVKTGFFQSEKFFDSSKINLKIKGNYIEKAQKILEENVPYGAEPVFIHIRRGDYLFESFGGQIGINLSKSYYIKAIEEIKKYVKNPFFIFLSDDPEFVECCFNEISNKYISRNDEGTDIALMSLCKYGVISNSSFSWWGAYFMKYRKKVIFPKYWYGWKVKVESHIGIIPEWGEVIEP